MKHARWIICLALAFLPWAAVNPVSAAGGAYVGGRFQGRIPYSCDGNHNDPDDWAASPVTLAILAEAGLKERLVHFMIEAMEAQGDWKSPGGKTPHATLYSAIIREIATKGTVPGSEKLNAASLRPTARSLFGPTSPTRPTDRAFSRCRRRMVDR